MNKKKKFTAVLFAFVLFATTGLASVHTTEARELGEFRTDARYAIRASVELPQVTHNFSREAGRGYGRSIRPFRDIQKQYAQPASDTADETAAPTETTDTQTDSVGAEAESNLEQEVGTETIPSVEVVVEETPPVVTEPEVTKPVVTEPVVVSATDESAYLALITSEIHRLTNLERAKAGLATLEYDVALAHIAEAHSEDMATNEYFAHTALDGCTVLCRLERAGYDASAWGENIIWVSRLQLPDAATLAQQFVDSWMESEGHRENILRTTFTHEGVGVVKIGNRVYATADFSQPQ